MSKTTVVHVITRLDLGGAQQNTLDTCIGLDRDAFDVVLLHGPGGLLDSELGALAPEAHRVLPQLGRAVAPAADLRAGLQMLGALRELKARHRKRCGDTHRFIVHTHTSKAGLLGRWAADRLGVEHVVHSIHGFPFHAGQAVPVRQSYVALERWAGARTEAFIAVCRANVAEAQALGIVRPHHRVRVIRSGMDLEPFFAAAAGRKAARGALGVGSDRLLVLSVANLKPQKDPLTLIRAVDAARRSLPQLQVWYAGDGSLRPRVEAEIARRNLGDHVRLLGWRRDVPRLLAACDAFLLTSRFEGLPRTVVQALAAQRPVIASRVDGTSEVLRDGVNGMLVEPGDAEGFAAALVRTLRDPPHLPPMRSELAPWSREHLIRDQEELYRSLVCGPAGGRRTPSPAEGPVGRAWRRGSED